MTIYVGSIPNQSRLTKWLPFNKYKSEWLNIWWAYIGGIGAYLYLKWGRRWRCHQRRATYRLARGIYAKWAKQGNFNPSNKISPLHQGWISLSLWVGVYCSTERLDTEAALGEGSRGADSTAAWGDGGTANWTEINEYFTKVSAWYTSPLQHEHTRWGSLDLHRLTKLFSLFQFCNLPFRLNNVFLSFYGYHNCSPPPCLFQ